MTFEAKLLASFPKQRPALPARYREIYVEHYRENREGSSPATSAAKRMEAWMHRKVAADTGNLRHTYSTLEIGAGTLNHLPYEPLSVHYDIVEPFVELYEKSPLRSRVAHAYLNLQQVSGARYDRIVSVATFEHICELPGVVARCGGLLKPAGHLRVAVPSEGTLLWVLGWKLTTGIEFRLKHGLDYGVLMRHEHVNTANEIAAVLKIFFASVRRSVFGVAPALSFYQFFDCHTPDLARCSAYF
jgi:hypothetical protein